jgi:hypothetical protein
MNNILIRESSWCSVHRTTIAASCAFCVFIRIVIVVGVLIVCLTAKTTSMFIVFHNMQIIFLEEFYTNQLRVERIFFSLSK